MSVLVQHSPSRSRRFCRACARPGTFARSSRTRVPWARARASICEYLPAPGAVSGPSIMITGLAPCNQRPMMRCPRFLRRSAQERGPCRPPWCEVFNASTPTRFFSKRSCTDDLLSHVTTRCPVPLTVRGTQALVSFAPLAFKLFFAARQNAVLRRSPFPPP